MCTLKLIRIGAAVVVLVASLWADVALAQDQIAIYRVLPVQVTRDSVLKLAREAFGMDNPSVTEDDITFMLQQEQKRLTVWKASGAILFADDSKLWNPDYRPSLPSLEEARLLGDEFIRKHDLIPPGGKLVLQNSRVRSAPAHQEGAPAVENHWELSYTLFELDTGLKREETSITMWAGALTLELGSYGEVIGLQRELGQPLAPPEFKPVFLQREVVLDWLRWKAGQGQPIELLEVADFGFSFRGSPGGGYSFILPGHRGWAQKHPHRDHLWYYIPATPFAVLARIRAPRDGGQFRTGVPIGFRAEIAPGFGTPPYRYLWYSNLDGILGQASTFRQSLSAGRHVITLWVSDRNGTTDAHIVIIQVDGDSGGVGALSQVLGAGLAGLGVLLHLIGLRRQGAALALSGLFSLAMTFSGDGQAVTKGGSWELHPEQQPLQQGRYIFWNQLSLQVSFAGDNGMELKNVGWTQSKGGNYYHFITSLLVPYIEVKPQGKAPIKLEIPNPPKFSRLSVLRNPVCDPKRLFGGELPQELKRELWGVADIGRELEAHYDLEVKDAQGQQLGTVNLVFSFRFYYPSWCRNSRAPEFYPQVRYTVQGFAVEKVRIPMRIMVEPGGEVHTGSFLRFVTMMVREPLPDITGQNQSLPVYCAPTQVIVIEPPGKEGRLVCVHREFMEENFDNYHQADEQITAPSCHRGKACFHFHMLKPALRHKFLVVQFRDDELEPQKLKPPKEPEDLLGDPIIPDQPCKRPWGKEPCELLLNPVFWYIAESDKPQDVFVEDSPAWPARFVGFSCSLFFRTVTIWIVVPIHLPIGYPACE